MNRCLAFVEPKAKVATAIEEYQTQQIVDLVGFATSHLGSEQEFDKVSN